MSPTMDDVQDAIATMSLLKFFPSGDVAVRVLIDLLIRLCSTREQLNWLVETLINRIGEWPGPAQLRALFCTRFPPADGIEGPPCELSGFTPADGEQRYVELEAKRGVLLDSQKQRLLPGEVETVSGDDKMQSLIGDLAAAKQMPGTPRTRLDYRKRVREILRNAEKA